MKLRIRGAVNTEIEWQLGRVPAIHEHLKFGGDWFLITAVAWAVVVRENDDFLYDVAIVTAEASEPPTGLAAGLAARDAVH